MFVNEILAFSSVYEWNYWHFQVFMNEINGIFKCLWMKFLAFSSVYEWNFWHFQVFMNEIFGIFKCLWMKLMAFSNVTFRAYVLLTLNSMWTRMTSNIFKED